MKISRAVPLVCRCSADKEDTKKSYTFVQKLGYFVHGDCGMPSPAYYAGAVDAGIIDPWNQNTAAWCAEHKTHNDHCVA